MLRAKLWRKQMNEKDNKVKRNAKNALPVSFLMPLVCLIIGILLSGLKVSLIISLSLFALLMILFTVLKNHKVKNLLICLLIILAANQYTVFYHFQYSHHISKLLNEKSVIQQKMTMMLDSEPIKKKDRFRYTARLISINQKSVSGKLYCYTQNDSLQIGQKIEALVQIEKPVYHNPGESLWILAMQNEGISASANIVHIYKIYQPEKNLPVLIKMKMSLSFIKSKLYQIMDQKFVPYSDLMKAILTGNTSVLSDYNSNRNIISYAHYQQAGVLHLLAVSGLHTGLIYMIFYTLISIINRTLARYLSIAFLAIFSGICGFSPSVLRASLMISMLIISKIVQRKQNFWQILSLSVFIILIINPRQLYDIGLLLSVTAVIALYLIHQIFSLKDQIVIHKNTGSETKLSKVGFFLEDHPRIQKICLLLSASFMISLFSSPFSFYFFNQLNLNALISNLFLIPLFSLLLSTGLAVLITPEYLFFFKYFKLSLDFLVFLLEKSLNLMENINFIFYDAINIYQMCLLLTLFLLVVLHLRYLKHKSKIIIPVYLGFVLLFFLLKTSDQPLSKVVFFSTGTSDAFLISTRDKENIVIDTADLNGYKAQIENQLIPYCLKNHIQTIDYLIISHPHSDHISGLPAICKKLNVNTLIVSDKIIQDSLYLDMINQCKNQFQTIQLISDTCTINLQHSKLKFLHPDKKYQPEHLNNSSLVVKWSENDFDFLFTGDIEHEAENWIVNHYGEELKSEFLKIPHHGSKTGSSISFLEEVQPLVAVIPAAKKNRFNFPHQQTLGFLSALNCQYFITGSDGAIICKLNSDYTEVHAFTKPDHKYYIKAHR